MLQLFLRRLQKSCDQISRDSFSFFTFGNITYSRNVTADVVVVSSTYDVSVLPTALITGTVATINWFVQRDLTDCSAISPAKLRVIYSIRIIFLNIISMCQLFFEARNRESKRNCSISDDIGRKSVLPIKSMQTRRIYLTFCFLDGHARLSK